VPAAAVVLGSCVPGDCCAVAKAGCAVSGGFGPSVSVSMSASVVPPHPAKGVSVPNVATPPALSLCVVLLPATLSPPTCTGAVAVTVGSTGEAVAAGAGTDAVAAGAVAGEAAAVGTVAGADVDTAPWSVLALDSVASHEDFPSTPPVRLSNEGGSCDGTSCEGGFCSGGEVGRAALDERCVVTEERRAEVTEERRAEVTDERRVPTEERRVATEERRGRETLLRRLRGPLPRRCEGFTGSNKRYRADMSVRSRVARARN